MPDDNNPGGTTAQATPSITAPNGGAQTTQTPTGPYEGWLKADGAFTENWADKLPETLSGVKAHVAQYNKIDDLLSEFGRLADLGKDSIKVPGPNATPAEKAAFRKATGALEKPEEYGLSDKEVAKFAAENGLTKTAAEKLIEFRASEKATAEAASKAKAQAELGAQIKTLVDAWGGKADENAEKAVQAAKILGKAIIGKEIDLAQFGSAELVQVFHRMHEYVTQSPAMRSGIGITDAALQGVQNARTRLNAIYENPEHAFWKGAATAEGKAAIAEVDRLTQECLSQGI